MVGIFQCRLNASHFQWMGSMPLNVAPSFTQRLPFLAGCQPGACRSFKSAAFLGTLPSPYLLCLPPGERASLAYVCNPNHIYDVPFPWNIAFSQVPRIMAWTSLEGFCLLQCFIPSMPIVRCLININCLILWPFKLMLLLFQ